MANSESVADYVCIYDVWKIKKVFNPLVHLQGLEPWTH